MTPRTGSGRIGADTGVVSMSTKMALLNLAGEDGQIPIPVPTRRSARSDGSQSACTHGQTTLTNNANNNSNSSIIVSSRSTRGTPRQGVPTPRSTRDMNNIQSFPSTDSHRSLNLKSLHNSGGGIHSSGGGSGGGGGGGGSMPSTPHHRTGTDRLDSTFVKEDEGVSQGDYLVARRAAAQQQSNKTTNNNTNNTTHNTNNNEGKISARERLSNPNLHLNLNGLTSHTTTGTTSTGVPTGNSLLQAKVTPRENYTTTTASNNSPHHLMAPSGSGTPDSRSTSSSPAGSPKSLGRFRSFLNNTFRI